MRIDFSIFFLQLGKVLLGCRVANGVELLFWVFHFVLLLDDFLDVERVLVSERRNCLLGMVLKLWVGDFWWLESGAAVK